jgi:hypothetical protein
MAATSVSKSTADQFLTLLAEGVEEFTFQTFDDNKSRKDKSLSRILHGSIDQHFDELCHLNAKGAGIFVTVNQTDLKGRSNANILDVRAIFQEADRAGVPIPTLSPQIVVETSPGKFHRYWLTHGGKDALTEYKAVMTTMVEQYGSDPNARDLARVLRLPGFFHQKDPKNPCMVSIVEATHTQPYAWNQITESIPPSQEDEKSDAQPVSNGFANDQLRVISALSVLSSDCDYQTWLLIGMALHNGFEGSSEGLTVWDEWSSSAASYREGETAYKWSSFGKGIGKPITLGSLFRLAADKGWDWSPKHQATVLPLAIQIVEQAIDQTESDPSAYLKDTVIDSFSVIKSCEPLQYETYRMQLKAANPKVRTGALDGFVKNLGGNFDTDNVAEVLVQLTCEHCELWHDSDGHGYASFEQENDGITHQQHWEINSIGFGEWLARMAHTELGKAPSTETLKTVKNTLRGRARFDGCEQKVFRRIGKDERGYWIDLCNDAWQAICVTSTGWRVEQKPSVRFTRTKAMRPLPIPLLGGSYDYLWTFLNIPAEDQILLLAWILESYRCDTPYPVMELTGEQGSAKSSTQTLIRSLIDPNQVMLRGRPKAVEDIYVSAKNNHLLSFENLSNISNDISDALCTVATGGGTAGRTLYTNDEETILEAHNPVVINGIGAVVLRQDLLDRTISICLPTIEQRRTEKDLSESIDRYLPSIFGGILTLFSESLAELHAVQIEAEQLPRMADFAKLGEAMAAALGFEAGIWLAKYHDHRKNAVRRTIDSSPVAVQCLSFVELGRSHQGTVKDLLDTLNGLRSGLFEEKEYWPRSPRGLGDVLRRIAPGMRLLGVHLSVDNKPKRDGIHCTLRKISGSISPQG